MPAVRRRLAGPWSAALSLAEFKGRFWTIALTMIAITLAPAAYGQESAAAIDFKPAPTDFWRHSAEIDIEAAYQMLLADHPGATPEVGDNVFRATLERSHAVAAARAQQVESYEGYVATLAAFANAFGDKHVRSSPTLQLARPDWAGVILAKRGDRWVVADEQALSPADSLLGARLVSCDGRTPDDWGKQVLGGFRADWSVEAQQEQSAPWLLVNEGNPFVPRPVSCAFDKGGAVRDVRLDWRPISRGSLTLRFAKANNFGAAGYGVRQAGGGYWIALQGLEDARAVAVVDAVRAQAAAMRNAPFVILDLRGNGGGSSEFGRQIAEQLFGQAYVNAKLGAPDAPCGSAWRVSPANLRELEHDRVVLADRGPEFLKILDNLLAQARDAAKAGKPFSGPVTCPTTAGRASALAPSFKGRLFLVTDGLCFSSCLEVVDDFRHLGAVQLGRTTDANTHYAEVSDRPMPSGLSTFSTLMAIDVSEPPRIGPFEPQQVFDGDIADTTAVQAWAIAIASKS